MTSSPSFGDFNIAAWKDQIKNETTDALKAEYFMVRKGLWQALGLIGGLIVAVAGVYVPLRTWMDTRLNDRIHGLVEGGTLDRLEAADKALGENDAKATLINLAARADRLDTAIREAADLMSAIRQAILVNASSTPKPSVPPHEPTSFGEIDADFTGKLGAMRQFNSSKQR